MRSLLVAIVLAAASLTASASVHVILDIGIRNGEPVYILNGAERPWEKQLEVSKAAIAVGASDPIYLRPHPETKMETIFKIMRSLEDAGALNLKLPAGTDVVDRWLDARLQK